MASATGSRFASVATALVALVLAHNLVFLAGYGASFAKALSHTGHDHGWSAAVTVVLVIGGATLGVAAWQLRRLSRLARTADAIAPNAGPGIRMFVHCWLRLSLRVALATAFLLVVQENVEHFMVDQPLPGVGVLGSPQYPNAIAIIAAVAAILAFVTALFGWRIHVLVARIRAALPHAVPARTRPRHVPQVDRGPGSLLGPGLAVRAPPLALAC
jgi:hypothetical protein